MIESMTMFFTGNQLIDALHRISHISKSILMIAPIRNSAFLEGIEALTLADSKSCLSSVFWDIMDPVQAQNQDILFQLFLIKSAAFLSLKEHQRADASGNRPDSFRHGNLIRISIHLCGR